jgi:hypothetical protein
MLTSLAESAVLAFLAGVIRAPEGSGRGADARAIERAGGRARRAARARSGPARARRGARTRTATRGRSAAAGA